jgi:hypothetical protein
LRFEDVLSFIAPPISDAARAVRITSPNAFRSATAAGGANSDALRRSNRQFSLPRPGIRTRTEDTDKAKPKITKRKLMISGFFRPTALPLLACFRLIFRPNLARDFEAA